jgi:propionyl-CoA carboxylase alpha chain
MCAARGMRELNALMPEKLPPDTSKMLLCPMPGLIVKVDVEVGDEVQDGQALCTVEAMKMENILRAERKGVVSKINAGSRRQPRRGRRDHGVRVSP